MTDKNGSVAPRRTIERQDAEAFRSQRRDLLRFGGLMGLSAVTLGPSSSFARENNVSSDVRRGMVGTSEGFLHYWRAGQGRPIVLMQTLPFSSQMFEALVPVLAQDFDCIAIDPMGYGLSDYRSRPWSTEEHAAVIKEGLDNIGVDRPMIVLGGHFCASIATELAVRWRSSVSHVILDGANLDLPSVETPTEYSAQNFSKSLGVTPDRVSEMYGYGLDLVKKLNPELTAEALAGQQSAEFAMTFALNALFSGLPASTYDMRKYLKKMRQETLLIGSPTDNNFKYHEETFALLKRGQEHVFETINPLYQFNRPERAPEYAAVIKEFVG